MLGNPGRRARRRQAAAKAGATLRGGKAGETGEQGTPPAGSPGSGGQGHAAASWAAAVPDPPPPSLPAAESDASVFASNSLQRKKKGLLRPAHYRAKPHLLIGMPQDFRQISSIIDVDILPETHRRVRLHKHGSDKPLGFYIRDGVSVRVAPQGVEKVPGIFISRLVKGGLAESTGLLAVSDEILEVNGIDVAGKSLDQVTDMMVANSHNLIITVKPANQRNNVIRSSKASGSSGMSTDSTPSQQTPSPASQYLSTYSTAESDEEGDLVIESDSAPHYVPGGCPNGGPADGPLRRSLSPHSSRGSLQSLGSHDGGSPGRGSGREDGSLLTL